MTPHGFHHSLLSLLVIWTNILLWAAWRRGLITASHRDIQIDNLNAIEEDLLVR